MIETVPCVVEGVVIKRLRIKNNVSRTEISNLLKINLKTLSAYENGDRLVKIDVLYGLSLLFNTSIDEIISESMQD